jgi:hypothetical protein
MSEKKDPEKVVQEVKRRKCTDDPYPPPRDGGEGGAVAVATRYPMIIICPRPPGYLRNGRMHEHVGRGRASRFLSTDTVSERPLPRASVSAFLSALVFKLRDPSLNMGTQLD